MITIYQLDAQGVFVGEREIDPMGPLPLPLAMTAPPKTTGDQVARWNGSKWEKLAERPALPVAPPKYATASAAKLAMTAWINGLTAQIQDEYPDVVQKGWIEEEAMATAFTAGTQSAQQLAILTADATSKGRTPAEHAARILEKAQAFRSIALQTRNLWLSVDKALDNATPDQFEAILQGAIAQAAPLAAAFGLKT